MNNKGQISKEMVEFVQTFPSFDSWSRSVMGFSSSGAALIMAAVGIPAKRLYEIAEATFPADWFFSRAFRVEDAYSDDGSR